MSAYSFLDFFSFFKKSTDSLLNKQKSLEVDFCSQHKYDVFCSIETRNLYNKFQHNM